MRVSQDCYEQASAVCKSEGVYNSAKASVTLLIADVLATVSFHNLSLQFEKSIHSPVPPDVPVWWSQYPAVTQLTYEARGTYYDRNLTQAGNNKVKNCNWKFYVLVPRFPTGSYSLLLAVHRPSRETLQTAQENVALQLQPTFVRTYMSVLFANL